MSLAVALSIPVNSRSRVSGFKSLNPPPNLSLPPLWRIQAHFFVPLLWRTTSGNIRFVDRRERNAAEVNSGNAVDPSAPVLNQPTSPQESVESRRLSPVQHKRGAGFGAASPISAEGAVPLLSSSLPDWEQKSCPQAERGGDAMGQPMAFVEGTPAPEMSSIDDDDISKLAEFFQLLDAWDRRRK